MNDLDLDEESYRYAKRVLKPIKYLREKIPGILESISHKDFISNSIPMLIRKIARSELPEYYYFLSIKCKAGHLICLYLDDDDVIKANNDERDIFTKVFQQPLKKKAIEAFEQYLNIEDGELYFNKIKALIGRQLEIDKDFGDIFSIF